jgi:glycogen(starch) synthase
MRIFHLSSEYPPQQVFGLGRAVHDLAVAQAALGEEVHVITNSLGGKDQEVVDEGVHVHRIAYPPPPKPPDDTMGVLQFNISVVETALQTIRDGLPPEVIHVHDWLTVHCGQALRWLCEVVPLVLTTHDTTVGKCFGKLGPQQQFSANLERWGGELADHVICCSEYTKQEMNRHYGTPLEKISVIPCGVDPGLFEVEGELPAWRRALLRDGKKLIGYVGRLDAEKGLEVLLEAMTSVRPVFPQAHLMLVGKGRLQEQLQGQINQLGLGDCVEFMGYLSGKPLAAFYCSADVMVVPSLYEPFGLVSLEAMVCAAPVIVSATGGLREITEGQDIAVTVTPGNSVELSQALLALLHDEARSRAMGQRARAHVLQAYNWPGIAESTLAVYAGLLSRENSLTPA